MNLKFIEPENQVLKEILLGYYITEFEEPLNYLIFPNNNIIISSSFNVNINYSGSSISINPSKKNDIVSDIICTYDKPFKIISKGRYKEITFVFNPLGFNSLIKKPLFDLKIGNNEFSPFILFDDYTKLILEISNMDNLKTIKEEIEKYWLSKHIGFKNETLKSIVNEIIQNPNIEINTLSNKYNISRQYLNRLFKLHFCKSPSKFKKTQRFRNALKKHAESKFPKKSLTNLTYESLYYDQSHLIKDFDYFSKMSPSTFFKKNNEFEKGLINWVYS
ncbi:helix-turn-helix domain-containing protein [Aquimarina megaterium]|uniref:helix-turn-helix domain-containing protein n=1 Tax=Aquimarina megaterium TaxID=1443666 RepID=UPI000472AACA|nr:helix-turn-helix domain-containing protein [Aquimarina megaterium]